HYKTDWWGERSSVWDDEKIADADALETPLKVALSASIAGRAAVMNPFGAVVPQNKRAMALFWEHIELFSGRTRAAIRRYLPPTARLESLPRQRLVAERTDWVLKSDYGCEGDEVVVGAEMEPGAWEECLDAALPGRFIAQRYFAASRSADGAVANHGVYLVAGRACGLYTRISEGATDRYALSAPVLVRESP
ncbi:MAG TPA: glutathionylspermidine synthase family protein, partial [Myxococcales bacterium]|nr:glutathionylspermidine synthase family protein [Myxococcales bacterium]